MTKITTILYNQTNYLLVMLKTFLTVNSLKGYYTNLRFFTTLIKKLSIGKTNRWK